MKKLITVLFAGLVAFGAFAYTCALAELKVASVNVEELHIMFYKRAEAQEELRKQEKKAQEDIEARAEKMRSLGEEAKALQAQADPNLSEDAIKALREKALAISNEYTAVREDIESYAKRCQDDLTKMLRKSQLMINTEVGAAVTAVAVEQGYDIVIDTSAQSASTGTKAFPYVKSSLDITAQVLKRLNADAPADFDPQAELKKARESVNAQ